MNEPNFAAAFDFNDITNIYEGKLEKIENKNVLKYLDELFCCYVSILIMENRDKEAKNMINKANDICDYFKMQQTSAKLELIKISLHLKNNEICEY